ncbi:MAG: hypothetical protein J3K34DRAFT_476583 [Monoraphidium minutum]|nr:MAG: hypothetical protein J3K34DRAFT_476583 [Monoraphidium minutum]
MAHARPLLESIDADEPTLWLQLECGARLPAHRELLQLASSCARGLPPGDTWDLRVLRLDGAAVNTRAIHLKYLCAAA